MISFLSFSKGVRSLGTKAVLLITDGQSTLNQHLTIPKAEELKKNHVSISVLAVGGQHISGIDEMVKVASWPPERHLFRVSNMNGFLEVIKLVVKEVAPGRYKIIMQQPYIPCHY